MGALGPSGFDLDGGETYLDGAYMTPIPRAARAAIEEAYRVNAQPWRFAYTDGLDIPDAVRERVSRVLGFPAHEIGLTSSTTGGMNLLANGLRWTAGDRVLLGPDEFPSNVYPWLAARERGAVVELLGERGRALSREELSAALGRPGRVRVVSIAATHYVTGELHPLDEFARLAHGAGALFVTDATQAAGAVAYDWPALDLDAVSTSGYKWLFGPYGTGAVWIRPSLYGELYDVAANWWANERARDISTLLDHAPIAPHGRRFDTGETASFLNTAAFRAGLDYLLEAGVARLEAHHRALQDRLRASLGSAPVRALTSASGRHRSPLFFLEVEPSLDARRLQETLAARRIRVSFRGGRLRVSPGAWNEERDVDALAEALRDVG